jgi:hypothetical protein
MFAGPAMKFKAEFFPDAGMTGHISISVLAHSLKSIRILWLLLAPIPEENTGRTIQSNAASAEPT